MNEFGREDDLLQARLDGELTPEQRAELEHVERDRPDLRQRGLEWAALAEQIESVGPGEPPAGFVATVMARVRPRVLAFRKPATTGFSGGVVMKKAMIGVAAAAAVAFVFFSLSGWPPADNSQGAIGAAKRYNAEQITEADVALGDTSAQEFVQSETFAKIVSDPNAVKLLSDASFRQRLADVSVMLRNDAALKQYLVADAQFARVMARADMQNALKAEGLIRFLSHGDVSVALRDADVVNAIKSPAFARALTSSDLKVALKAPDLVAFMKYPGLVALLQDGGLAAELQRVNLAMMLQDQALARYLTDAELMRHLTDPNLALALTKAEFVSALKQPDFALALSHASFAVALRDAGFEQSLQAVRVRGGDLSRVQ